MSHLDPQRRATRSELRSFGFLVGGAFIALAAVITWRTASPTPTAAFAFAALGTALAGGGLLVPQALGSVFGAWMRFAILLSRFTTPLFMGAIYFLVLTPIALIMRAAGRNPLRSSASGSRWVTRSAGARASALERQF